MIRVPGSASCEEADMRINSHDDLIRDQFTRQAESFSSAPPISDEYALAKVVAAGQPAPNDDVLDLACGGGLIVCAFAPHVRHATGIDLTPAMLERSRALAAEKQLGNVTWQPGDVRSLPWPGASFNIVVTRFSFITSMSRSQYCAR
jgi:ubiquinone/menaquinone biosynthesis C-methylase UbiE